MRQRPELTEAAVAGWVRGGWGLQAAAVRFMAAGNDESAWAYVVGLRSGERVFLKVRLGSLNPVALLLPRHLRERGLPVPAAPIDTPGGDQSYCQDGYQLVLYPFVGGQRASVRMLSDEQWLDHGAFLNALHRVELPPQLAGLMPVETFGCAALATLRAVAERFRNGRFGDHWRRELARSWRAHQADIDALADRVDRLGELAHAQRLPLVVCHADLHANNILVDDAGLLRVVDWDAPILAPRERDLMFVVGTTIGGLGATKRQQELFWREYGRIEVNWPAMAYHRYQRVVEDIAEFARSMLVRDDRGEEATADDLAWFGRQFAAGGPADLARRAEHHLTPELSGSPSHRQERPR